MADYVKLSKGASMFHDPATGVKVVGDKVVKLPKGWQKSKFLSSRIRNGHLNVATESEYLAKAQKAEDAPDAEMGDDEDTEQPNINKMKKAELVEYIMDNFDGYEVEELEGMKVSVLKEIANDEAEEE